MRPLLCLCLFFYVTTAQNLNGIDLDALDLNGVDISALIGATPKPDASAGGGGGSQLATVEALGRGLSSGGILNNLFNSFQLGVKNAIDQLVPAVQIPSVLPASVPDLSIGELRLPNLLGGSRLIPSGCPVCQSLDHQHLIGTWTMMYANDNFIKSRLSVLGKMADMLSSPTLSQSSPISTIQHIFNPIRYPVCMRMQVGIPRSFGFLLDFPVLLSYNEGRPHGLLRSIPGNLRQVDEGKYLLMFAGGKFFVRFCAVASNIFTQGYPPRQVPNVFNPIQPQATNPKPSPPVSTNDASNTTTGAPPILRQSAQLPKYFALSDSSGFPACQNYVVFANDPDTFLSTFDPVVTNFIRRQGSDNDANPLTYVPCPATNLFG